MDAPRFDSPQAAGLLVLSSIAALIVLRRVFRPVLHTIAG